MIWSDLGNAFDMICQQCRPIPIASVVQTCASKDGRCQMRRVVSDVMDQAPRALRVSILAFLAGYLLYLDHPGHVGALPAPVYVGLLYAALITPTAVATAMFLPGLTRLSDAVQIARLAFATAVALFPALLRSVADQPMFSATVVILGGMAIVALSRQWPTLATVSSPRIHRASRQ